MEIHFLNKKDTSLVVEIHRKCVSKTNSQKYSPDVIREWLGQISLNNLLNQLGTSRWCVVREGNRFVGFCQYDIAYGELYQIQVDPEYQGKGYGKHLYQFVENEFNKYRKRQITLNSTLNALPFYEKMGFKKVNDALYSLGRASIKMVRMEKAIS